MMVFLLASLFLLVSLAQQAVAEPGPDADAPPPEALVGEIPFHPESPPSRVMIDLAPAGSAPFVLMLDTGASGSWLTPGTARTLGVSIRRTKSSPYRKHTSLGRDLQFWVDDSRSDTGGGAGGEYGLLGGEFLDDYVLEIDYPGRMVRFYDPRKYAVPETSANPEDRVLKFRRSGTRILAEIDVEGTTLLTLLDTGAPALMIAGREAEKAKIDWKELPELHGVGGVLGPIKTYTYVADELGFAGFEFDDQPMSIAPRGGYNQAGPTDSALGYDILGHFVIRIDYDRKRIWLRRNLTQDISYWGDEITGTSLAAATTAATKTASGDAPPRVKDATQQAAEWERAKATRLYAETPSGSFVVVEGHRLRSGPKQGEVWYTHEEMLARRKERASGGDTAR